MKSFLKWLVIASFSLILLSCKTSTNSEVVNASGLSLTSAQIEKAKIRCETPQFKKMSGVLSVAGMLHAPPQEAYSVSIPYSAQVTKTILLEGLKVTKGQVLIELESPEFIQLQMDYIGSAAQAEFLQKEFDRQQVMRNDNITALRSVEEANALLIREKAKANGLKEKLSQLGISASSISNGTIQKSVVIRSPINGYVTKVNVNLGKVITANDVLCTIVNTSNLHAELKVFESDVVKLRIGQKIKFKLANDETERNAELMLIGREIEDDKTIRVHGHITQDDGILLPGTFLRAEIQLDEFSVLAVKSKAVVMLEGKPVVFIQTQNSSTSTNFEVVPVSKGLENGEYIEVKSEKLSEKSLVVQEGAFALLSVILNKEEEE